MSFKQSLSKLGKKAKDKLSKFGDRIDKSLAHIGSGASSHPSLSDTSGWKNTGSSAAKLFLRTVERSSDVFPPLKSVAAGLCAILDNCEVLSTFARLIRDG